MRIYLWDRLIFVFSTGGESADDEGFFSIGKVSLDFFKSVLLIGPINFLAYLFYIISVPGGQVQRLLIVRYYVRTFYFLAGIFGPLKEAPPVDPSAISSRDILMLITSEEKGC